VREFSFDLTAPPLLDKERGSGEAKSLNNRIRGML